MRRQALSCLLPRIEDSAFTAHRAKLAACRLSLRLRRQRQPMRHGACGNLRATDFPRALMSRLAGILITPALPAALGAKRQHVVRERRKTGCRPRGQSLRSRNGIGVVHAQDSSGAAGKHAARVRGLPRTRRIQCTLTMTAYSAIVQIPDHCKPSPRNGSWNLFPFFFLFFRRNFFTPASELPRTIGFCRVPATLP